MIYSMPPGQTGHDFVVVVHGSVEVGVAMTHFHPSSQTSQATVVGQIGQSIGVAAQSIHSITVTVFGAGQMSVAARFSTRTSRFCFAGEEVWMGLMYCVISSSRSGMRTVCSAELVARTAMSVNFGMPVGRDTKPCAVLVTASVGDAVVTAWLFSASMIESRAS